MPPKKDGKKRVAAKGYKLPEPIPSGLVLCDILKNQWRLGKSIGQGGFGEIYLASDNIKTPVSDDSEFVVKIEPHSNGPLFTEMHCYIRIGKPNHIENWKKEKRLKHLGMPKYLGSGSHEYKGEKYRFLVMERFGEDLQKIINKYSKKFSYKTVFQVVIQILDVLEYIHFHGYIHADIKASNLLIGHRRGSEGSVFLVDYGLACKYQLNGKHKEYKYDQRRAHDGTIEFTSRDAHIGAHSRRGDLEILGYNLVQWLSGRLPWEDNLGDCNYVANKKRALMEDIPEFMRLCFSDEPPPGIQEYLEYVSSLAFDETPNYEKCRLILREGLRRRGYKDDGKLVFNPATPKAARGPMNNGKAKVRKFCETTAAARDASPLASSSKRKKKKLDCNGTEDEEEIPNSSLPKKKAVSIRTKKKNLVTKKPVKSSLVSPRNGRKRTAKSKSVASRPEESIFDNPTPAMLAVLMKRKG